MSRSRKDVIETEEMLCRLAELLRKHDTETANPSIPWSTPRADAESLRRISITLHRWYELECGDSNDHASWCLTRGKRLPKVNGKEVFQHDDNGDSYLEWHPYDGMVSYRKIPDREKGALARLAKIMVRYPSLQAYVQGDPRGCALYILRPGDVPAGEKADAYYSRGLAVHQ